MSEKLKLEKKSIIFIDGARLSETETEQINDLSLKFIGSNAVSNIYIKDKGTNKFIGYFNPKLEEYKGLTLWSIEPIIVFNEVEQLKYLYRQITIKKFFTDKNGYAEVNVDEIEKQKQYLECGFKRVNQCNFVKF